MSLLDRRCDRRRARPAPSHRGARKRRTRRSPRQVVVPDAWQVLVDCRDEATQKALFERLTSEGFECRVLTL